MGAETADFSQFGAFWSSDMLGDEISEGAPVFEAWAILLGGVMDDAVGNSLAAALASGLMGPHDAVERVSTSHGISSRPMLESISVFISKSVAYA